jgi:hypothetical protein
MIAPIVILAPLLAMHSIIKGSDDDTEREVSLDAVESNPKDSILDRIPSWLIASIPFICGWLAIALSWWFCYSAYELKKTTLRYSYQIDSAQRAYRQAVWDIYHPAPSTAKDTVRFTDFYLSLPMRNSQPVADDVTVPLTSPKVNNDKKIP